MQALKVSKLLLCIVFVFLLIGVRAFETTLFYDPFIAYYKLEYAHLPFPKIETTQLILNLVFRYSLNTVFSLGLIYVLFRNVGYVKMAAILFALFGVVLLIVFFIVYTTLGEESKMTLFYIRRFIIQPLFLLLFIPAFLWQEKKQSNFTKS